ncbi:MAG: bifunctional phosphopantothenoylcysteine decarboxylase/phosphopantothenate synthase [Gemmataceae bacterium]|nr:bifunctional phosphopantothenoylcysteine decarboxylase/phosphopantothenate synthase [Gemmataceae bacterium]
MNILITAGNTLVPIDRVRCITNIFTGRTGASIALQCHDRGHSVTLLTSHPEVLADLREPAAPLTQRCQVRRYRTFDDLQERMGELVRAGGLDAVIHCAAVSDYRSAGVYAPAKGTHFEVDSGGWSGSGGPPTLEPRTGAKLKSDEGELWLRMVRTPKIVDQVRSEWGFRGVLVKFKLEVDVTDERLLEIAEASRRQSDADLMVANTLEGAFDWAFLGPLEDGYERVMRRELAGRLLDEVERLCREKAHG